MVGTTTAFDICSTITIPLFFVDIRKQEEVLQESYMMVPDSKSRLERALGELSELLVSLFVNSCVEIL